MPLTERPRRMALPLGLVALLLMAAPSCASDSGGATTYRTTGRVVEVTPDGSTVKLEHDAIDGYMDAMTMGFPVEDPSILDGIAAGDTVEFELTVTEHRVWVSAIEEVQPASSG